MLAYMSKVKVLQLKNKFTEANNNNNSLKQEKKVK